MHYAVVLLLGLASPAALHPDFVELFTPLEYRYTGGRYDAELFRYRLFVPRTKDGAAKPPLIVWLHGYGEHGSDNAYQLRWLDELVIRHATEPERYPFFLLAVQCPTDNAGWQSHIAAECQGADGMIDVVAAIIDQTLQDYAIDRERVYLSGVSNGGSGCWKLAIQRPDLFAAIAPLASDGADNTQLQRLINIPTWTFHSHDDPRTAVAHVQRTVKTLKQIGGSIYLTEIATDQHDCWTAAFRDHGLLDWLLSQRRNTPSPPPGPTSRLQRVHNFLTQPHWWHLVLLALLAPPLLVAGRRALRRLHEGVFDVGSRPETPD